MVVKSRLIKAYNKIKQGKKKKRVLIIDDDSMSIKILTKCLHEIYDIVAKSDGNEAMDYLHNNTNPDIIILDIEMPNMNGRVFL